MQPLHHALTILAPAPCTLSSSQAAEADFQQLRLSRQHAALEAPAHQRLKALQR